MPTRCGWLRGCRGALPVLVLLLACHDEDSVARPTDVTIVNTGSDNVYLDGLFRGPFSMQSPDGNSMAPAYEFLCSDCSHFCSTSIEYAPCYLELTPGGSLTMRWDGRAYVAQPTSCSCATCSNSAPFVDGDYVFQVPLTRQLPDATAFRQQWCWGSLPLEGAALTGWTSSTAAMHALDEVQSFTVQYRGQSEIVLPIQ